MVNCGIDINFNSVNFGKISRTPKSAKLASSEQRQFLFDAKHIRRLVGNKADNSKSLTRQRSVSSDEISNQRKRSESAKNKGFTSGSLSRLSECPDDVFTQLPTNPMIKSIPLNPLKPCPELLNQFFLDPKFKHDLPPFDACSLDDKLLPFGEEPALRYDVCLGYLLYTLECDDMSVCVYSLQRNKQIMESVITPLAAVPGGKELFPLEALLCTEMVFMVVFLSKSI